MAATLKRSLTLPMLVLYGLGTTVGAGIYALIGEVAARAGMLAPLAFVVAGLLAAASAFSFAELGSRLPRSAGEVVYVQAGFGRRWLAIGVGLLAVAAGVVSAATVLNAFYGYLSAFVDVPRPLGLIVAGGLLGAIVAWGITESVLIASAVTLVEVGGLVLVIATGAQSLAGAPPPDLAIGAGDASVTGVLAASLLAFYAFLGFEDMVNVAEEVKSVERTMPRAIVITLVVTTLVYLLVALAAVLAVAPAELGRSEAPLMLVIERGGWLPPELIGLISMVAIVNGAMIQMIMASRILYGLAAEGAMPAALGRINDHTRTPLVATALVVLLVLGLAVGFPLAALAEATSITALLIFTLVNASLWLLKGRGPAPIGVFVVPRWVPAIGACVSLGFVLYGLSR